MLQGENEKKLNDVLWHRNVHQDKLDFSLLDKLKENNKKKVSVSPVDSIFRFFYFLLNDLNWYYYKHEKYKAQRKDRGIFLFSLKFVIRWAPNFFFGTYVNRTETFKENFIIGISGLILVTINYDFVACPKHNLKICTCKISRILYFCVSIFF